MHLDQAPVYLDEFVSKVPDKDRAHSLEALQTPSPTHPPSPRRQSGSRSGTRRRASKKPRNRRGGWKPTTGLTWSNVQEIHDAHHGAAKAGKPLNQFISIRPLSHITDDALRKKLCYRRANRRTSQPSTRSQTDHT